MGQVLIEISLQITADKKLRYAPPKLPSATSFIRKTLSEMPAVALKKKTFKNWKEFRVWR